MDIVYIMVTIHHICMTKLLGFEQLHVLLQDSGVESTVKKNRG